MVDKDFTMGESERLLWIKFFLDKELRKFNKPIICRDESIRYKPIRQDFKPIVAKILGSIM